MKKTIFMLLAVTMGCVSGPLRSEASSFLGTFCFSGIGVQFGQLQMKLNVSQAGPDFYVTGGYGVATFTDAGVIHGSMVATNPNLFDLAITLAGNDLLTGQPGSSGTGHMQIRIAGPGQIFLGGLIVMDYEDPQAPGTIITTPDTWDLSQAPCP